MTIKKRHEFKLVLFSRHERQRAPPGPEEPVEVEPHDEVGPARRRPRDAGVVEEAVERVEAGPMPERADLDLVAEARQAVDEALDADERAASLARVQRRGRQAGDAQGASAPGTSARASP